MRKKTNLSMPHRILLGVTLFTFLAAFSAIGVLIVLKTASDEGLAYEEVVLETANLETEKEQPVDQTKPEEAILLQPAKLEAQPAVVISNNKGGTPLAEPTIDRTTETSTTPSPQSVSQPGNNLIFDDSPEGDSLVIDATLFQEEAPPQLDKPLQPDAGISIPGNPAKNALGGNGPHAPKGSLHQMALLSKAPTVTNGLDPASERIIVGKEGSRIKIPAGSLVFEDGTPCNTPYDAKIWEFYDFTDILLSGLTTMSDQGPLQTGGMTYLEVSSGGRKLNLAEGSKARVSFAPFYETNSDFGLYDGTNEDGQILWSKVEQKEEVRTIDRSRISVSELPESLRELSQFGKIACLMNQDSLTSQTKVFGKGMHDQSFTGEGLVRLPNGTAILFDGKLEIMNSSKKAGDSSKPSMLETRFEGKSLMILVPPSSQELFKFDSEVKVFLPEEGFPVPFISTVNTGSPTLFSYRKGKTTTVEALHGDIRLLSTKKRTSLSGQSYSYEKYLKKGTSAPTLALTSALSTSETLGDWGRENFSAFDHLNEEVLEKGQSLAKKLAEKTAMQNTIFTNFNRRNSRINPNANILLDPRLRNQNGIDTRFSDWNELLSNLGELQQIAVATDNPVAAEKFLRTRDRLDKIAEDSGIEAEALLEANLEFRREFLSPNLGWHNLDKLRKRGGNETYALASNELDVSTSLEETNSSISMGPFYFSVWPQERVSLVAGTGQNSIPQGEFTSLGYFLSKDGRIFADIAKGNTGKDVSLDLKEMEKEDFRNKVKSFL
jgi:hypothetical protein